jgi:hypothetical protein
LVKAALQIEEGLYRKAILKSGLDKTVTIALQQE